MRYSYYGSQRGAREAYADLRCSCYVVSHVSGKVQYKARRPSPKIFLLVVLKSPLRIPLVYL
jgi:hypothetical protein